GGVSNIFGVFDGELHGESLRFDTGKKGRDNVRNWQATEDYITWHFRVARAGAYRVTTVYGANEQSAGGTYEILIGTEKLAATVSFTGGEYCFEACEIGRIEFKDEGEFTLTVKPCTIKGSVLMNLKEVTVVSL
ncbi:alpha-L-fucosidase, partial [Paenibacillus sp. TAF58]